MIGNEVRRQAASRLSSFPMNGEPVRWGSAGSFKLQARSVNQITRTEFGLPAPSTITSRCRLDIFYPPRRLRGLGADAIGKAHERAGEGRGIGMGLGVAHRRNPTMARKERGLEARRDPSADRRSRYPGGTPSARRRMWGRVSRPGGGTEGGPRGVGRRGG